MTKSNTRKIQDERQDSISLERSREENKKCDDEVSRFRRPLLSKEGFTAQPNETSRSVLRYLEPGNQDFFSAVNRNFFHYKSRELKQVMRALTSMQHHPHSLRHLDSLEQAIYDWETQHPKEIEKRGRVLSALKSEISVLRKNLSESPQSSDGKGDDVSNLRD